MAVVGDASANPGSTSWFAMVLGVHGFYIRLASLTVGNAISYPINSAGPTMIDIAVGTVGLILLGVVASLKSIRGMTVPAPLRAAAVLWLCGWFPASRIVLPVRLVVAADRYLLLPTLGVALAIAVAAFAIPRGGLARAFVVTVCIASAGRTLVAQAAWRDSRALWERALDSNPHDAAAWSQYSEALADAGAVEAAERAASRGLELTGSPRLELRRALLLARRGDRTGAVAGMRRAADRGEPIAMTNLAVMLAETGKAGEALTWARKAVEVAPLYSHGFTVLGRLYIALGKPREARTALERALSLDPACSIRFELGRALAAQGDRDAARKELLACFGDATLRPKIWAEIVRLSK
jgi:Flp pilus assembly protein TadD